ncbi:MAG: glycosyltransferase family 4 protein [Acidimicrobiales bacterium]
MAPRGGSLLVVSDTLAGGLGAVAQHHARWFRERGWSVTLAAPLATAVDQTSDVVDLAIPTTIRHPLAASRAAIHLRRIVARAQPDVVHVHGLRSAAIAVAAGIRRPHVTVHGITAMPSDPPAHGAARRLGRWLVPRIAAVAASAEPGYGPRWRYTPFASPRLAALGEVPFPPATAVPTFAWLGSLDERKQPEVFVRAIADLAASGQPVRGIVAGTGPRAGEIARLVHTTGAPVDLVGHADPVDVLGEAWALALFSRGEGTPLVVEEAMWARRSVVASRLPGIEQLVGTTGTLIDQPSDAAVAFAELCEHERARRAGEVAGVRIRAILSLDDPWPAVEASYVDRLR